MCEKSECKWLHSDFFLAVTGRYVVISDKEKWECINQKKVGKLRVSSDYRGKKSWNLFRKRC